MGSVRILFLAFGLSAAWVAGSARADSGASGLRLADPLDPLTSLALRYDWDTEIGGFDEGKRQTLTLEPTIPFRLDSGAFLISRTTLPVLRYSGVADDESGLGDLQQTLYYTPSDTDDTFAWGLGAALRLPTASDNALGHDAWAAGPAGALVWRRGAWRFGAAAQHLQAFGGDDDDVDLTLIQPFVARHFDVWSFGAQADAAFDWDRDRLKGPLTLYARRLFDVAGRRAWALEGGFRYWIDGPTEEPEWGLRLGVTLLL